MNENVIPIAISERMRASAVKTIREVADQLEAMPRERLPDVLLRLPVDDLVKAVQLLR